LGGTNFNRLKHEEKLFRPFLRYSLADGAPSVPVSRPALQSSAADHFFRRFVGMLVEEMEIDFLFSRAVNG
jgi:hypothetical protein